MLNKFRKSGSELYITTNNFLGKDYLFKVVLELDFLLDIEGLMEAASKYQLDVDELLAVSDIKESTRKSVKDFLVLKSRFNQATRTKRIDEYRHKEYAFLRHQIRSISSYKPGMHSTHVLYDLLNFQNSKIKDRQNFEVTHFHNYYLKDEKICELFIEIFQDYVVKVYGPKNEEAVKIFNEETKDTKKVLRKRYHNYGGRDFKYRVCLYEGLVLSLCIQQTGKMDRLYGKELSDDLRKMFSGLDIAVRNKMFTVMVYANKIEDYLPLKLFLGESILIEEVILEKDI